MSVPGSTVKVMSTPHDHLPSWLTRVGVFDLETTGVDVVQDRIVTAHVGVLDARGGVLSSDSWLADPGIPIPDTAAAVHGITTEQARAQGRAASTVIAEVRARLAELFAQNIPVVAFNAPFDFTLLQHECLRHGLVPLAPAPVIDPLVIDRAVDRYRKGKRTLDLVAAHYDVALMGAHEAAADAQAAGRVALALARRYPEDFGESAEALHATQRGWARQQAASLTDYLIRVGRLQAHESVEGEWPVR